MRIECPEEEDTERRVSAIILLVSVAFRKLDIIDIFMGVKTWLSYPKIIYQDVAPFH